MPHGKPAGVRCVQLGADERCALFGRPDRPAVCAGLRPSVEMCGESRGQAIRWLNALDLATRPHAAVCANQAANNISVCRRSSSM